ncbi:MAG: pseudouridine synthase [Synergistetes bacterium]|nr:pseudouridine synthase [Synergistota bacterium]MCX8127476.1 pseudouridine synthase [Synergistota bacterium]MDW8192747.1 pseudouridine synthase [Synergistota bacterium]
MKKFRLDRYISSSSEFSRSEVRNLIRKGKVLVNGREIRDPSFKVQEDDEVSLDGVIIGPPQMVYIAMFKPAGFLSVTLGNEGSVLEILKHPLRKRLSIAGRLDKDVEGLLLLSNDGQFIHRVISPRNKVEKEYHVWVEGSLPENAEELVEKGLILRDGTSCRPGRLIRVSSDLISLTICEGMFHQVKNMCYALGVNPVKIRRIRIGPVFLDGLREGDWRELTSEEVEILKR